MNTRTTRDIYRLLLDGHTLVNTRWAGCSQVRLAPSGHLVDSQGRLVSELFLCPQDWEAVELSPPLKQLGRYAPIALVHKETRQVTLTNLMARSQEEAEELYGFSQMYEPLFLEQLSVDIV